MIFNRNDVNDEKICSGIFSRAAFNLVGGKGKLNSFPLKIKNEKEKTYSMIEKGDFCGHIFFRKEFSIKKIEAFNKNFPLTKYLN